MSEKALSVAADILTVDTTDPVAIAVREGDVELLRYVIAPDTRVLESPKPYLDPIRTRAGRVVSLFRPWDHVWHKGIAWSLPVVDAENFWGGPTYVHGEGYVQLPNNGTQAVIGTAEVSVRDGVVSIGHNVRWSTESGVHLFDERRRITAQVLDESGWAFTFEVAMTNVHRASVRFGSPTTKGRENAGYGGLFWRGPRSFTDGTLLTAVGSGSGAEMRGQRHEWVGFLGRSLILTAPNPASIHLRTCDRSSSSE